MAFMKMQLKMRHTLCWCVLSTPLLEIGFFHISECSIRYHRGVSIVTQTLPRVMLTFNESHLYPTWKLHSASGKDEIESPLR